MTLSHKFKTIGNGVPYLTSQGVAKTILDFLNMKNINYQEDLSHQLELPLVYSLKSKYVV